MDYYHQSITDFFRGPLLATPQGWVVIGSSALYLVFGLLIQFDGFPSIPNLNNDNVFIFCVFWPVILFLYFVRECGPSFAPSLKSTIWMMIYAMAPIGFWLYDYWHTLFS